MTFTFNLTLIFLIFMYLFLFYVIGIGNYMVNNWYTLLTRSHEALGFSLLYLFSSAVVPSSGVSEHFFRKSISLIKKLIISKDHLLNWCWHVTFYFKTSRKTMDYQNRYGFKHNKMFKFFSKSHTQTYSRLFFLFRLLCRKMCALVTKLTWF